MIRLSTKQLRVLHNNLPSGTRQVIVNVGPSVAESGTVTVDYYSDVAAKPIYTIDIAPDGTLYEYDEEATV